MPRSRPSRQANRVGRPRMLTDHAAGRAARGPRRSGLGASARGRPVPSWLSWFGRRAAVDRRAMRSGAPPAGGGPVNCARRAGRAVDRVRCRRSTWVISDVHLIIYGVCVRRDLHRRRIGPGLAADGHARSARRPRSARGRRRTRRGPGARADLRHGLHSAPSYASWPERGDRSRHARPRPGRQNSSACGRRRATRFCPPQRPRSR